MERSTNQLGGVVTSPRRMRHPYGRQAMKKRKGKQKRNRRRRNVFAEALRHPLFRPKKTKLKTKYIRSKERKDDYDC